jgi:hypothetical protein
MTLTATDRIDERLTTDPVEATGATRAMWVWTLLRLLLGWSLLWAFIDKMFGLGFATCRAEDSSAIDFGCDAATASGGSRHSGS